MIHRIDVAGWKEFRIGELFDIIKGRRLTKANMIDGDINFIGSSSVNNGITALIGNTEHVHPGGVLTVCYNGSVGETFYQSEPFWASDDVNILEPKTEISRNSMLFVGTVIRHLGQYYNWTDKWTRDVMLETLITLPITSLGNPDWEYMDSYMARVMDESFTMLDWLLNKNIAKNDIDTSSWREYSLKEDLGFNVFHGVRLNKAHRVDGAMPFVTAGAENRGVKQYIDTDRKTYINSITVDMFGNCFYHPYECCGDDNVYFFVNYNVSSFSKMFIATSINAQTSCIYNYKEQFRQPDADSLTVKLPVSASGNPDWAYMDAYMSRIMNEVQIKVDKLNLP